MTLWRTNPNSKDIRVVLIVSQDSKMSAAWSMAFKQRGCYVIHEKTPRHALQAARLIRPSLVIVDLDMPQAERLSLCSQIRPMIGCALLALAPQTGKDGTSAYRLAGVDERLSPTISPSALLGKSLAWLS